MLLKVVIVSVTLCFNEYATCNLFSLNLTFSTMNKLTLSLLDRTCLHNLDRCVVCPSNIHRNSVAEK